MALGAMVANATALRDKMNAVAGAGARDEMVACLSSLTGLETPLLLAAYPVGDEDRLHETFSKARCDYRHEIRDRHISTALMVAGVAAMFFADKTAYASLGIAALSSSFIWGIAGRLSFDNSVQNLSNTISEAAAKRGYAAPKGGSMAP